MTRAAFRDLMQGGSNVDRLASRHFELQWLADREEEIMKRIWLTGVLALMMCGGALAQDIPATSAPPQASPNNSTPAPAQGTPEQPTAPANSTQSSDAPHIAPGSVIPVQLTKSIDAKKVKTGDRVEAKVTQDLKSSTGVLVVPRDTKVMGHVTQAQARNKEQKESQLGLAFDHAVMKNGGDVPLPMSIQAIIAPPSPNDANAAPSAESPNAAAGNAPTTGSARPGATPQQSPVPASNTGTAPADAQNSANARQAITGDTQGVVGMPNVKLLPAQNAAQGSVLSSEKNNVKLESGTFLLLRVNQ